MIFQKVFMGLTLAEITLGIFFVIMGMGMGTEETFVEISPSNWTGQVGTDIEFKCQVGPAGTYKIVWIKEDFQLIVGFQSDILIDDERFSIVHNGHNKSILRIRQIRVEDAGKYKCEIDTDPPLHQSGLLTVQPKQN